MKLSRTISVSVVVFVVYTLIFVSEAQENGFSISNSLNAFSINLLAATSNKADDSLNIALSPLTIWTLLTVISEGARGNTARQLENALLIPSEKILVRNDFRNLTASLTQHTNKRVKVNFSNAIFVNKQYPIKADFVRAAEQFYKVDVQPVNFKNTNEAVQRINNLVAKATENRIPAFVHADDVHDAQVFLTSVLHFKGQWKTPFNRTATKRDIFYDEKGNRLGEVNMMYQFGVFPYSRIEDIKAHAVELPYGNGEMAMIVLLPFKGKTVSNVLNLLTKQPFVRILQKLDDAEEMFVDEDIHVYLPKFSVTSDFNMNGVLDTMGIKDVFDSQRADLLGIVHHYLFVSRLIQRAEIEVDEEGTVASAAAGASFANKSPPPKFQADRPFLYFIVDKVTQAIVFAGKITNPHTLK